MTPQEELTALRRMAELEAKASGAAQPVAPTSATAQAAPAPQQDARSAWDRASAGDIVAGLPAVRGIVGLASPVIGAAQVGANVGDWISQKMGNDPVLGKYLAEKVGEYEAAKKRGMAALGDPGGTDILGMAGAMATGGMALKGMAPATSYAGRIAQGVGVGAGAGATAPTSTPGLGQTALQTGTGAALGGAVPMLAPVIAGGAKAGYRMAIEPWKNPEAIKGRAYLEAAGSQPQDVLNALRNPAQQIVPGSMPTAGQAGVPAGRAEWAALQKSAEKVLPSEYLARSDAQNVARINQLRTVGGDKAALTAAEASRDANALVNYAAANNAGVDRNMAAALQPQIESLMRRPAVEDAKKIAMRLAADNDVTLTDFGSVQGLDWLKKGLDKQIEMAAKRTDAIGASDLKSLMQSKDDLLSTIKQIAPAYDVARGAYAAESAPINQMRVGQYLENKLVPALGEEAKQKAASFVGAVRDAPGTLKRSLTGGPRYEELTQVLTPKQMAAVESVQADLARGARFEDMAQRGGQAGGSAMDVATQSVEKASGGGKIPNPLSRVVTVANAILGRLEGKINKKLALEIAQEMLSPVQTANALEAAMTRAAKSGTVTNALSKNRIPLTVGGVQNVVSSRN